MAVFAVGDVQGCMKALRRLLELIRFDAEEDYLWFSGDLVNRGPDSLEVLRFVRGLGDHAISVLGNHDLHLLAMAAGIKAPTRALSPILEAEDGPELIDWLKKRPLLWHDDDLGYVLVHAGIAPCWTLQTAKAHAQEIENKLTHQPLDQALSNIYGNQPVRWDDNLRGLSRQRLIINIFTRMRYVTADGEFDFTHSGSPGSQPASLMPWFLVPDRQNSQEHIVFGHWSTLGQVDVPNIYPLDTGCVWGGSLSALRLDGEDGWFSVPCGPGGEPSDS